MLIRLLVRLVDSSRRHSLSVVCGGVLLAVFAGWIASAHLGVSTDTDLLFKDSLPWRQQAVEMNKDFPHFLDQPHGGGLWHQRKGHGFHTLRVAGGCFSF